MSQTVSRPTPKPRSSFGWSTLMTTRWHDNDQYGHVNNVVYYAWFDTAVNRFLIEQGLLDLQSSDPQQLRGLVVNSSCNYFAPASFPSNYELALRVDNIGNASVRYELGVFNCPSDQTLCIALGSFTHVYVSADSQKPVATLPAAWQAVLRQF